MLLLKIPATLSKRGSKQVFSRKYCEVFKSNSFEKHLRAAASEAHLLNTKLFIKIILWKTCFHL